MTMVSMAAAFTDCCEHRFAKINGDMPLDQAREEVRWGLGEMEKLVIHRVDHWRLSDAERRQAAAAMGVLRCAFEGVLTSVKVSRIRPAETKAQAAGLGQLQSDSRAGQRPGNDPRSQDRHADGGGDGGNPLSRLLGRQNPQANEPKVAPEVKVKVMVMTRLLYDQLFSACEAVDRLLEAAIPPPVPQPVPWARDQEFLQQAHSLLAAHQAGKNGDGQQALKAIAQLAERLRTRYDVEAVEADEANVQYFDVSPDPRVTRYETVIPALMVGGEHWGPKGTALRPVAAGPAPGYTSDLIPGYEGGPSDATED